MGKSKLRAAGKTSTASLGPQYRGARVSRADLEAASEEDEDEDNFEDAREELASSAGGSDEDGDDVFDDPETADLEADHDSRDVEIDSDDAFGESDEERFKDYTFRGSSKVLPGGKGKRIPRATAADFLGSDEDEEGSEDGEDEDDEDEEGESLGSEEEDSDDEMIDEQRMGLIDDEAVESDEDEEDEDGDLDGFIVDSDEDEEDEDGESDQDNSDDEDDEVNDNADRKSSRKTAGGRDDMASLVATGSKSVTSSLSDGQQKDVAKGTAIRQQRKAFDALLNVRIRLQKSLVAINTLPLAADASAEDEPPYEAAEAAALKLWNAIDSFRSNLSSSGGPSKKRKRSAAATTETTSQQIWESIEATEQRAAPRRRAVLQNWSQKANNIRTVDRSSSSATRNKFSAGPAEKTLVGRLDEEMENPERLVKRTRTPRSCAPAQVARKVNEDSHIYDDADFYQLLLKELVDQRTADTSAGGGAGAAAAATVRFAAVKEAKAKKHVDTKASKGRKMRFNVHDKLQNFMAPEDRRSWEQTAIDRLFGTLFGQKMALNEDDVSEDEEMDGGVDAEEAGLRLFRS